MWDVLLGLLLLVGGPISLFVIVVLITGINAVKRQQREMSTRFTAQLHAVYDSVQQQNKKLDLVLKSVQQADSSQASREVSGSAEAVIPKPVAPEQTAGPQQTSTVSQEVPAEDITEYVIETEHPGPEEKTPSTLHEFAQRHSSAQKHSTAPSGTSPSPQLLSRSATTESPAQKAAATRVPSQFESAAKDVLKKIWNWIIVGEDHLPKGVSVEFAIASQWLLRIGILLVVFGVGFFLKYSIDNGLLSPLARTLLSVAAGFSMLGIGARILGGRFHIIGQGLFGGGISTLYFSAFAASGMFKLIDPPVAFAAMAAITVLSGFLALRFQSRLTAVIGVIGGYLTPVLLSTGVVNFPGLYSYLLILGVGVLGVSAFRRWPLLSYLSFVGHHLLVVASLRDFDKTLHFWQVMPFLVAFFVMFSTMVFIYNLRKRVSSNLLDVLVLFLNAGAFFGISYNLIDESFGYRWVSAVTVGLAAFYVLHVYYCLARKILDRELMLSFIALSAFFLAITVPLLLTNEWITVTWAVQALVMLWISGKLQSQFLRMVSMALYLIVLGRFAFLDLGSQFGSRGLADLPVYDYLKQMAERLILFGVPIGSMFLGYRLLSRDTSPGRMVMDRTNDINLWVRERWAAKAAMFAVFGMLFFYLHLELNRTFGLIYPPVRLPALTLLWLGICVLLILEFAETSSKIAFAFLSILLLALFAKLALFDLPAWNISHQFWYDGPWSSYDAGFRLLDFGAVVAFFVFAFQLLVSRSAESGGQVRLVGNGMGLCGLAMLFLYLTLEVNSFLRHYVEGLRSGGVSILWSLFALSFLLRGIQKDRRLLRYLGLGLFVIVAWKVFFVDLARLDQLYRIIAFIALGLMVLAGSFLYLRSRSSFETHKEPGEENRS